MKITKASHLDHGLSDAHLQWLRETFSARREFFVELVQLPEHLPPVPCGLYGPRMGDPAVDERDAYYAVRGGRAGASRMTRRPMRMVRNITVVAGPLDAEPCVMYTAFAGPSAPREPFDVAILDDIGKIGAAQFWAWHALADGTEHES